MILYYVGVGSAIVRGGEWMEETFLNVGKEDKDVK